MLLYAAFSTLQNTSTFANLYACVSFVLVVWVTFLPWTSSFWWCLGLSTFFLQISELISQANCHYVAWRQVKLHRNDNAAKADSKADYYPAQLSMDCGHESLLSAKTLIGDVIRRQSLAWLQWQGIGDWLTDSVGTASAPFSDFSEENELQSLF